MFNFKQQFSDFIEGFIIFKKVYFNGISIEEQAKQNVEKFLNDSNLYNNARVSGGNTTFKKNFVSRLNNDK